MLHRNVSLVLKLSIYIRGLRVEEATQENMSVCFGVSLFNGFPFIQEMNIC